MQPYYIDEAVTLYCADCRDVLPTLGPVDHVITDPPYSEHVHGKSRAGSRPLSGSLSGGSFNAPANFSRTNDLGFDALTPEVRAVVAGHLVRVCRRWTLVFSDVESAHLWRAELCPPLDYCRTGAWVKLGATPQFTGDRPATGFEAITIAHPKRKKRWNGGGSHAVWTHAIVQNRNGVLSGSSATEWRCHTTQKPESLMSELVTLFTDPGDTILDPFAGSGTTLVAAKRLGRKAIGIEISEDYCKVAIQRLRQRALPLGEIA